LCCVPQERSVVRNQIIWTLTTHEREGDLISQLLLRIEQRTVGGLRPGVREGGSETEKEPNISAWMSFATRGGGGGGRNRTGEPIRIQDKAIETSALSLNGAKGFPALWRNQFVAAAALSTIVRVLT